MEHILERQGGFVHVARPETLLETASVDFTHHLPRYESVSNVSVRQSGLRLHHSRIALSQRMIATREDALSLLRQNFGFDDPEPWIDYARRHAFKRVRATPVPNCPDCGRSPLAALGQYVYYSTLIRLQICGACHLIWADARLDARVLSDHFETAYKDRDYFRRARSRIFRHLAEEIGSLTPRDGRVLDIGGAQGDLMHLVKQERPDVTAVVHDPSENAARHAEEQFGLPVIRGDISVLKTHDTRYDVIVLSDVLYYEHRIADFWRLVPRLVAPGGAVVLRVPNKLLLIQAHLLLSRLTRLFRHRDVEDQIRFFNPEHVFILTRRYLTARLSQLGCASIRVLPSPLLSPPGSLAHGMLARILNPSAAAVSVLSGRKVALSPSMLVIGSGIAAN